MKSYTAPVAPVEVLMALAYLIIVDFKVVIKNDKSTILRYTNSNVL